MNFRRPSRSFYAGQSAPARWNQRSKNLRASKIVSGRSPAWGRGGKNSSSCKKIGWFYSFLGPEAVGKDERVITIRTGRRRSFGRTRGEARFTIREKLEFGGGDNVSIRGMTSVSSMGLGNIRAKLKHGWGGYELCRKESFVPGFQGSKNWGGRENSTHLLGVHRHCVTLSIGAAKLPRTIVFDARYNPGVWGQHPTDSVRWGKGLLRVHVLLRNFLRSLKEGTKNGFERKANDGTISKGGKFALETQGHKPTAWWYDQLRRIAKKEQPMKSALVEGCPWRGKLATLSEPQGRGKKTLRAQVNIKNNRKEAFTTACSLNYQYNFANLDIIWSRQKSGREGLPERKGAHHLHLGTGGSFYN